VEPGQEQTFDYVFRPDARLEPLEFWLSGWVIVNQTGDAPALFQNYWTNATIDLVERPSDMNVRRVFTYFLAFAAAALVAYIAYHLTASPKKSRDTERGTREGSSRDTGFEVQAYKPAAASKAVRRKRESTTPKKAVASPTAAAPAPAPSSS